MSSAAPRSRSSLARARPSAAASGRGPVTSIDGSDAVRGSLNGPLPEAAALGRALASELLDRGAAELMAVSR